MRVILSFIAAAVGTACLIAWAVWAVTRPADPSAGTLVFTVPEDEILFDVAHELARRNLVRNESVTRMYLLLCAPDGQIVPGGYRVSASLRMPDLIAVLYRKPALRWVRVRPGTRQEQIGEQLAEVLGWDDARKRQWTSLKAADGSGAEGKFFPGTYLLPSDEPVPAVAEIFFSEFRSKTGALLPALKEKGQDLQTILTIASLIQREAAGPHDMPLVSGVIWNRIRLGMRLDIDATLQYVKGSPDSWWSRVVPADKFLESPYNTYRNTGLPPGPISNASLAAITAALNPESTDCLFYLHAPDRRIHCSVTYEEHKENIRTYLR